jgi:hypothetical protein
MSTEQLIRKYQVCDTLTPEELAQIAFTTHTAWAALSLIGEPQYSLTRTDLWVTYHNLWDRHGL